MSVHATFRAPGTAYPLGAVLPDHPGVAAEVERVVPTGGSSHYVWVEGDDADRAAFVAAVADVSAVRSVDVLDELADRTLLRVAFRDPDVRVVGLVTATGGTVTGLRWTGDRWSLHVRFPDRAGLTAFYEACRRDGVRVELRELFGTGRGGDSSRLTERQATTLRRAFAAGYFEVPRDVTLADLSRDLGVSEQAVSERLRRGLASLLAETLTTPGDEESVDRRGEV